MLNLSEYQIHSILHEGFETIVYRGQLPDRQSAIILKLLKSEYPTLEAITRLKHEYQIRKNLDCAQVVKAIILETFDNRSGLVLEDFGGESLGELLKREKLSTIAILNIAIQIVKGLAYLHQNQIIHKDIKPSNIIINSQTKQVKITDFGTATKLHKENQQFNNPNSVEGTLAYMSPEQTGRMNRTLDYRTDFYSLGITLYEMLIGKLPFASQDPLEIVYSHIALQPISPHQLNPQIPPAISEIVMKLLAKNAEARYQSAAGLLADLEICLQQLETTGEIADFTPGSLDILSQLSIPQKLYGREAQVNQILAAFERVGTGSIAPIESSPNTNSQKIARSQSELMLVSGYSGIGKSAVVNEVSKPITRSKGYFISGKFDQFKRNIPYASLIQAFNSLLRQLLTESADSLEIWRTKILAALGTNGKVIADVIPEVELIIGKQPEVTELGPVESQNRFNRVFKEFIRVFAQKEHPLVIFLDDLQWADSATLKLMQILITDPEQQYLLLLGAYRDNEVSPTHPLIQTVEEIEKTGTVVNNIVLQPLNLENVTELIADTLNGSRENVNNLAELICNKTGGNPFFLTQLLQALYQENLLKFEFNERAKGQGEWTWNIEEIQAIGITDKSVVELVASRIEKLPAGTQEALKLAACVGDTFALDVLSIVREEPANATAAELYAALQTGLILPLNDAYRIPLVFDRTEAINLKLDTSRVTYKFLHDRVQQAAYSLIPDGDKKATHLNIGKLLLENTPDEKLEDCIFDIVNQLNVGIDCLNLQLEKDRLAGLNLIAGRKAKAANAYEPAVKYLNAGISLLAPDCWICNYSMTLPLYVETLEAEYLNTNLDRAETLAEVILHSATNLLDRVKVYQLKLLIYQAKSQMLKAVETGLQVLEMLGIDLLNRKIAAPKLPQIEELPHLPVMTDPYQLAAMEILTAIYPPAFIAKPEIVSSIVLTAIDLCIEGGHSALATFPYTLYGMILCGIEGDIETGYYCGLIASKLLEQFNASQQKARVSAMCNGHITIWKEPLRNTLDSLLEGMKSGVEAGDIEWAIYNSMQYITYLFWVGEPLEYVEERQAPYMQFLLRNKHEFATGYAKIWQLMASTLRNKAADRAYLVSAELNEAATMSRWQQENNRMSLFAAYVAKLMLLYLFKDYAAAVATAKLAAEYADGAIGLITVGVHNFYYSLAILAHYPHSDDREEYLAIVNSNQQIMKKWADSAPMNYQHKYDLVEAEKIRLVSDRLAAIDYYDRAISGAAKNGYIQEEALACELAGEFYQSLDKQIISQAYLTKAYYGYIHWGAIAKVKHLESIYPFLLAQTRAAETPSLDVTRRTTTGTTTSSGLGDFLDVATFIKSAQAINSEIVLEKLLAKLIEIILENAAVQKVVLLSIEGDRLYIEAVGTSTESSAKLLQSMPLENSQDLPVSVINYVSRSKQDLVLQNATVAAPFNTDPYIIKSQTQSILCLPIIYQSNLQGIIYLENNLAAGIFTTDRVEVLKALVSQIAIALENAHLYAGEQEKSQQLEKSLSELQQAQLQLIQSEKMSSLGNLVAGVAHEINNPVGFIAGNISEATAAVGDLINHLQLYREALPNPGQTIEQDAEDIDLEYTIEDLPKMLSSMKVGCDRIRNISTSLRTFSRADTSQKVSANIHEGIDSTLMILQHRLKANSQRPVIQVVKNYGDIPQIKCYLGQLNQVFMNILANAIDCFEESNKGRSFAEIELNPNIITIATDIDNENQMVVINIRDNGRGIPEETISRIFDHLFTTKEVGKGTGLGLSISKQIVEETHGGKLTCQSMLGCGTEFAIALPLA